jgi:ribosomal protein S18 acetylase RimI-like enzyme
VTSSRAHRPTAVPVAKRSLMALRTAQPADAAAVAAVHVRSWQVGYRGLLPDDYLDGLRPEDRARRYKFGQRGPEDPETIVAVERGAICGFATTGSGGDDDPPGAGQLLALYVDPARWSCGIGRALIQEARARLRLLGFGEASVWVLVGNERADRFYRRDRWAPDGCGRLDEAWGLTVEEIRYRTSLG